MEKYEQKHWGLILDHMQNLDKLLLDGSFEIRRENSPVEVGSLSHYLQGFFSSQVVQDFFHQQYDAISWVRYLSFTFTHNWGNNGLKKLQGEI